MLAIETNQLTKSYAGRAVVSGVELNVPLGCVYGFLGPNGSGKTTTMRLLLGLLRADGGRVRLVGQNLATARRAALANVGALIEAPSLYDHLSGRSNLDITRRLLGQPPSAIDRVLELVELRDAGSARVGTYSLGMKQRLALARATIGNPRLLLLDEPTNGLDPDGIIVMRALIRALPNRIGGTVFVSSHLLSEVEQVADHAGLMRSGRLIVQDRVDTLLSGGTTVAITVDDAVRGAALLRAAGLDADVRDEVIRLRCSGDATGKANVAKANRLLVDADLAVSAIVPQARTLEDVYRETLVPATAAEQAA
jgi:ABC-type multidrug transport system ATPase subunit